MNIKVSRVRVNSPSGPVFEVIRAGMMTTLQDLGRPGFQRLGVSPGGAMDPLAFRLANRLLGNPEQAAALEITVKGPLFRVLGDCWVAVTGGNLSPLLESTPLPMWRTARLIKGQSLSFGEKISGARAYLSIDGGFSAPEVLGSRSTDLQSRFGGLDGRRLLKGDFLFRNYNENPVPKLTRVSSEVLDEYHDPFALRVVEGPQTRFLLSGAMRRFLESEYVVTPASNRIGYRLQGPTVGLAVKEIISDPVALGSIQVLSGGQLVLLMADHQTVGGYPKIATLISADVPKAAQLCIGDHVRFQKVSLETAHQLLRAQERRIERAVIQK
jgi:antagonist of KipI